MLVDSGLHPILDPSGNFQFSATSDYVRADLAGSKRAQSSSPIDFGGYTGGEYRTQVDPPDNDSSLRSAKLDYDLWVQDPKYAVYPNPLSADVDVYAPGASMMIINGFVSPTEVWGDIDYSFGP